MPGLLGRVVWGDMTKTDEKFRRFSRPAVSPAAMPYLEQMAQGDATTLTKTFWKKQFKRCMRLYPKLGECQGILLVVGFRLDVKSKRKPFLMQLNLRSGVKAGFDHVLLVTGEANYTVNINYFLSAVEIGDDFR